NLFGGKKAISAAAKDAQKTLYTQFFADMRDELQDKTLKSDLTDKDKRLLEDTVLFMNIMTYDGVPSWSFVRNDEMDKGDLRQVYKKVITEQRLRDLGNQKDVQVSYQNLNNTRLSDGLEKVSLLPLSLVSLASVSRSNDDYPKVRPTHPLNEILLRFFRYNASETALEDGEKFIKATLLTTKPDDVKQIWEDNRKSLLTYRTSPRLLELFSVETTRIETLKMKYLTDGDKAATKPTQERPQKNITLIGADVTATTGSVPSAESSSVAKTTSNPTLNNTDLWDDESW
ncbi:MAG: hypothetical protein LC687_03615, partial [Actinobacteria bacterium]|nr:hypothetical protein [Actinomycetota bacterium]